MERKLILNLAFLNMCRAFKKYNKHKRIRRWAIRPINRDRIPNGYFKRVFLKKKRNDEEKFFIETRMTVKLFELLLNLVDKFLQKPKQQIGSEERLAITLLYLAHGTSFEVIGSMYKLGKSTIRMIVLETCEVLWSTLSPIYLSEPSTAQYEHITEDFKNLWNMPNCVGAIDGKHVAITCPNNSGSMYYNYKKFYSVILMATCDAKYTFTWASVGSYGSQSDGGVFQHTSFGRELLANQLPLPSNKPLWNGSMEAFPHFFVGDAAFPLKQNLMRPYPGAGLNETKTVFNYRLSRARRVIENAFGILTARWRVLRSTIECSPENCEKIVLGCLVLHNFIMLNDQRRWYCPNGYDGVEESAQTWRDDLAGSGGPLPSIISSRRNASSVAFRLRDTLADYFVNQGAVSFQ